ncbi:unnamed protein product [Rotaria sp. Silwood2]|nr:unnamed protein product [Rotaria sp. Silwood2]
MAAEQEPSDGFKTINDQSDFHYWQNQMKYDTQFIHFMTEIYKKQQLDLQVREQRNKIVTHHTRSSSIPSPCPPQQTTRHLSRLMDKPIISPFTQQKQQLVNIHSTKTSFDNQNAPLHNKTSSTPRRPLDDSNSPENQVRRQVKKPRPHEPTPTSFSTKFTSSSSTERQFRFPPFHLKHAVSNNLPCFYINFSLDIDIAQQQLPSAMKVANWIRQVVQQQSSQSIGDFSLLIPAGKNRYKFGVTRKKDFLMLWNCNWPNDMNNIKIEIERPRVLPDCCALVLRYVPPELTNEFVFKETVKSIKSTVSFSKINYHRPRSTNDYRFCVTDENEYDEIISIGRLAIGHILLPVTAFISGLKMTYCTNCWELGHIRPHCKVSPRCRKCLDAWDRNHKCQKSVLCAQCQGPHSSLSMDCLVVKDYRRSLKDEVDNAVKGGWLHQVEVIKKAGTVHRAELDFPALQQTNVKHAVWGGVPSSEPQNHFGTNQLSELVTQIKYVLDITRRMESKIDNQVMKLDILDKRSSINKQGIIGLANIMQQTITAMLEKKNKQQLQKLAHQIEEFKDDIIEKFNAVSSQQQQNSTPTSPSLNPNKTTKPTTTSNIKENNVQMEEEQSMVSVDD